MNEKIHQIFPMFEPDLVKTLADEASVKSFAKGDVILRSGEYIQNTFLVVSGLIKVYREDDLGNEFLIYYIHAGEACALSLVCASKLETSKIMAKALADTTVFLVPLNSMELWMSKYKSWYEFVVNNYRNRFEELLQLIDNIAFSGLDNRLTYYLSQYVKNTGSKTLELSHQEIANELNSSREVISRLLKKMEQKNYLKLHRNQIELYPEFFELEN